MKVFRILDPFFHALGDGKIIRSVVSVTLCIFAAGAILGGVLGGIMIGRGAFTAHDPGTVPGSLLFAALWLISGILQCGILLYRVRTITALGDSPFTVTSIVSVFCRLIGEELFVFFLLLGIGGFLYEALAHSDPFSRLGAIGSFVPHPATGGGLAGASVLLVLMASVAFLAMIASYAIAELTVVLVDIAHNMHLVRLALAGPSPHPAMAGDGAYPATTPPALMSTSCHCRICGNALDPGTVFCGICGTAARD